MESLNTLTLDKEKNAGFTLTEVLISVAILALIASLGIFISMDFYKNSSFRSERGVIVSVLQKARSQSLNNVDEKRHGVHLQANPLKYIVFECSNTCNSYAGSSSSDESIDSSYNISVTSPALPVDIIFDQLSGSCVTSPTFNCSTGTPIGLSDGTKSSSITINSEGRIDW